MNPTKTKAMIHFGCPASKRLSPTGYAHQFEKSLPTSPNRLLQKVMCPQCHKSMSPIPHSSFTWATQISLTTGSWNVHYQPRSMVYCQLSSTTWLSQSNVQLRAVLSIPRLKHCYDEISVPCTIMMKLSLYEKVNSHAAPIVKCSSNQSLQNILQVNGGTAIQAAQLQEQEWIARLANTAHNIRFYINDTEIENVTKYTVSWMNNQCRAMARHSLQAKREEPQNRLREGHLFFPLPQIFKVNAAVLTKSL
jgi:hypothetical protein